MGRVFFELLEVAVFDLLHEGLALEEIGVEIGGELARDDEKLIADHFRERDGAARGDEMRAPLEHEADVPEDKESEECGSGGECGTLRAEELRGAVEENSETDDEERGERNEKAVAVRRDARPVGIARDQKIKRQHGSEEWRAGARLAPAEENQPGNCENKDGSPNKQAVVGGKQYGEKGRGAPEPVAERDVAGCQRVPIEKVAREEGGEHAEEEHGDEEQVTDQEVCEARGFGRFGPGARAASERREILARRFDGEDDQKHGVGVINVEHEAGDEREEKPLGKRAGRARLMPIPEEKSDGESGMRVRPRRIEVHVDGQGASPPDGDRGEERPTFADVLARETEGE